MDVAATTESPFSTDADTIVVGLPEGAPVAAGFAERELEALVATGEAKTAFRHLAMTHVAGRRVIAAGLGPLAELDPERAREVAALAMRRARDAAARVLCWRVPQSACDADAIAAGLVHGTVLGAYRFDTFKPAPDARPPERLIISADSDAGAATARAGIEAAAQNRARDLGNRPPNDLTPSALADYAVAQGVGGVSVTVLGEAEIRDAGMGAFAAVAQGSDQEARLIALRYDGGEPGGRRLALCGKAVTFDSGGLWLKPSASMIEMKFDMAGGAAVIEAIAVLAQLGTPVNVLGVVGATENLISGGAVKPGDIVTALDGTTIEVNNTDAEGRLVLADCITYARREGCDAIVDVATLTGGVVAALGSTYAGVFANDDGLAATVQACAERTGELVWRLPLHPRYADMVKGRYAQLTNRTERREAAAVTAAEFLHHFAGDVPWAHLDIAGVGDDGRTAYLDKGATGWGVRLLTEVALSL
jgi:leucyl aminopeptidase